MKDSRDKEIDRRKYNFRFQITETTTLIRTLGRYHHVTTTAYSTLKSCFKELSTIIRYTERMYKLDHHSPDFPSSQKNKARYLYKILAVHNILATSAANRSSKQYIIYTFHL